MRRAPTDLRLKLSDGRTVGIAQFGAPHGRPVLYCHGFPASRFDAELAHEAAVQVGARVIALDRPGYGLSDPKPGRRIRDWPRDVGETADALGLHRFAVLGISGGALYSLACAALLADRVTALGVVCGFSGMSVAADCTEFNRFARGSFWLARTAPQLSSIFNRALAPVLRGRPRWTIALLAARLPPPDRDALADPAVYAILSRSLSEALRQGGAGAADELLLFGQPWDFDAEAITAPCYLWHGEQDTTVPVSVGRRTASKLAGCRTEYFAAEGHYSLPVKHMRSILAALLRHAA